MSCVADASLAGLHVQRAALYETLCSFATTDADDGLEDAISETKQVFALTHDSYNVAPDDALQISIAG